MKYIIVATQLCSGRPYSRDVWQKVFYFSGYDSKFKKLKFDERAKFALKLDSYLEAVDILNFQRNCDIQKFLRKIDSENSPVSYPYCNTVEYLKELDAKMKYEIICVED